MNSSLGKDIKAEVYPAAALDPVSATAGGAGDAAEVDGLTIDQQALPTKFNSVDFEIVAKAVLAEDKTLTVTGNLQDSADGSAWTDRHPRDFSQPKNTPWMWMGLQHCSSVLQIRSILLKSEARQPTRSTFEIRDRRRQRTFVCWPWCRMV